MTQSDIDLARLAKLRDRKDRLVRELSEIQREEAMILLRMKPRTEATQ